MSDLTHALDPEAARNYILGGHGKATLVGKTSRFTYSFGMADSDDRSPIFVRLLTGPQNEADYQYIGFISADLELVAGRKGKPTAPGFQALAWYLRALQAGPDQAGKATFYHEGVCCCCGRTLTTPESILAGIGPKCAARQ